MKKTADFKDMYVVYREQLNEVRDGLIDGIRELVKSMGGIDFGQLSLGEVLKLKVHLPNGSHDITGLQYSFEDLYLVDDDEQVCEIEDLDTTELMLLYQSLDEMISEDDYIECPICGSPDVTLTSGKRTPNDYAMYYCNECGNEFSDNDIE